MTNSTKKPAKVSRDNFDFDLDARLDQATSTLSLNDEPVAGDALDQVLAHSKKELDADLTKEVLPLPIEDFDDLDGFLSKDDIDLDNEALESPRAVESESLTSLKNQLSVAMGSASVVDEDLDSLLGDVGFDFDSLLGETASDELVMEAGDDALMATVDELLNFGAFAEEAEITLNEDDELENTDVALTVEPETALEDLIDTVPFEETLTIDADDDKLDDIQEEFNDFDDIADMDTPLVEMSASIESFVDDVDDTQQLDGLNEAMENKNDTPAGFDLLDDDAVTKEPVTSVPETVEDDDWMKQLDGLDDLDADKTEEDVTPVNLKKPTEEITEASDDDDWMKQLDGLDDLDADKTEEDVTPVNLKKSPEENSEASDDDDWMKQLDGLDDLDADKTEEDVTPVNLKKSPEEITETSDDDDDWMKQLDNLDDRDEDTTKMLMDAGHGVNTNTDEIVDNKFNITDKDETPQNSNPSSMLDENTLVAKAAALAASQVKDDQDHVMSQLRADQDSVESKNRKQFVEAENKRKKTATFGYMALGVGVIGLLGSAGIGWMSYGTKTDATNLTQTVAVLEEKVNTFLAKNPEKEIENIKTSVEQLNQKVDKIAAAQVAVAPVVVDTATITPVDASKTPSVAKVDLSNGKKTTPIVPSVDVTKVAESGVVPPPVDISPALPTGETALSPIKAPEPVKEEPVKLADMVKKPTSATKDKLAAAAKAEAEKAAVKAEAELLSQKIAQANAIAKLAAISNSKAEEQRKALMQSKADRYTGRMTRGMARGGNDKIAATEKPAKTKNVTASVVKPAPKEILKAAVKPQKAVAAGNYSVNMISYQQEWFAQSKAAELKQKGIPVEVVPIDPSKPGTKFRLKVGGFKNKAEASAYANKIKQSSGGQAPWVGVNN